MHVISWLFFLSRAVSVGVGVLAVAHLGRVFVYLSGFLST
jgi:hypothetical protein